MRLRFLLIALCATAAGNAVAQTGAMSPPAGAIYISSPKNMYKSPVVGPVLVS
jgi:hypothetical protein